MFDCLRIYSFEFRYPISLNLKPIRIFCYFGSDFSSGFSGRVWVRVGKMTQSKNKKMTQLSCKIILRYMQSMNQTMKPLHDLCDIFISCHLIHNTSHPNINFE